MLFVGPDSNNLEPEAGMDVEVAAGGGIIQIGKDKYLYQKLSHDIIGAAIEVHRERRPGACP
jgi:hypothetical protein